MFTNIADFTYHKDHAKRVASTKVGLVATGDIGYFDADGFLYLCDRSKDMIISGGVNIYPAEIEASLHRMPGVADCAVFGIPDDEYGEAIHAVVQPQPGVTITQEQVGPISASMSRASRCPSRWTSAPNSRVKTQARFSNGSCASPSGLAAPPASDRSKSPGGRP